MVRLISRRGAVGAVVAVVAGRPRPAHAAPPTATVVGTSQLALRSCPEAACRIVATVPLGASVTLTGEAAAGAPLDGLAVGKFIRVNYERTSGYAPDYFLTVDPMHVPYLIQGEAGCKRLAILFNVGVGFAPVEGILETLVAAGVPAAMFVMGWWADAHPPILARMAEARHLVASHGYDAIELTGRSDAEVARDVRAASAAIEHATGHPPAPYFTHYAAASDERVRAIVAANGFLPVLWTVAAADYGAGATEDAVYQRVMDGVHDGALIEFHLDGPSSAASTGRALPRLIDDLQAAGYRFVSIPEMIAPCLPRTG